MTRKITISILSVIVLSFLIIIFLTKSTFADSGLILEWKFNEGSGTTALDSSGNGNVGTLYNGPTYVAGIEGSAISLNGVDQYVQVDSPFAFLGTANQPYALSAWVNVPNPGESGNIIDLSSSSDGSGWCIPFLTIDNGVFSATSWDSETGPVYATDTTQVQPNQWYQVITTWDPSNGLRLFVNGTLVQSTPQPDYAASGVPMYFSAGLSDGGACSGDEGFLNGAVDDARLYNSVLTTSDIQDIYSVGTPIKDDSSAPTTSNDPAVSSSDIINAPDTGFGKPISNNLWYSLGISSLGFAGLIVIVICIRSLFKSKS